MIDWSALSEFMKTFGFPVVVALVLLYDKLVYQPRLIEAITKLTVLIENKRK